MHSQRPFSTLRRCLLGGTALAALTLTWCAAAPAQEPVVPPPVPVAPAAAAQGDAIRIEIGEETALRSPSGKNLKQVFATRPGIVKIGTLGQDPTIVKVTGQNVGTVDITLVDDTGAATRSTVRVLPDMTYVRDAVNRHYPRTSLTIERVGELTVVVSGYVELAEQIDGIVRLIESLLGQGYVVNNIRLAGVVQVQLEVCVAQVRRSEARRMGFNWLQAAPNQVSGSTVGGLIPQPITGPAVTSQSAPPGFITSGSLATLPSSNLILGIFDENTAFFGFLDALRSESLAKVLAQPTVTTLSGRAAEVLVGGEAPYGTAGSSGTSGGGGSGIQYKEFGTYLKFVPIVLGNGRIRLDVVPEISSRDLANSVANTNIVAPAFNTIKAKSTIELESGQTIVIGGLLQNIVTGSTNKIPVLGDLPFVGMAFRTVSYAEEETETIIVVTPYVIDALDCHQRPKRLPGHETRTPTDFELFLEGILEAPRGQRPLKPEGHYRPAHYWAPAHCLPYGTPKCADGACGTGHGTGSGVTGSYGTASYITDAPPSMNPMPLARPEGAAPVMADKAQGVPQEANPLLPPQQPVSPASFVPESNQPKPPEIPAQTPAPAEAQRPELKDSGAPVLPPVVRPSDK